MQRREILKTLAGASGLAGLPAAAAAQPRAPTASGEAWLGLAAAMAEVEQRFQTPPFDNGDPGDRAQGRRFIAQALQTALLFWADADPDRPRFTRFVGPHQKLLGDNPDTVYYFAPLNPAGRYRIRGEVSGATYTSFTVERGTADGSGSKGLAATLNDTQFDVRPDGTYEILVGGPPQPRNWLALTPDAGSITTRHYFEWPRSAAADPSLHIPLSIERLDPPPLSPRGDDPEVAASLQRAARFFRAVTLDVPPADMPRANLPYSSKVPNRFTAPDQSFANQGTGFAARDNVYLQTRYELGPDEALVMRGRFPRCRFANVMLWNRYYQTYDYANRRISLNPRQTTLEKDGSFRIVIAHRDPGGPNWIDTEGRPHGYVFWRFLLPEGPIEPVATEVVKLSAARA